MKTNFTSLFVAAAFLMGAPVAMAAEPAREVMIGISDAYVPAGFDSNSDAFVVTNGVFPNGCYRYSRAEVTHQDDSTHIVKSYATVQPGMCLMVLVPFTKEVLIGKLQKGSHTIRFLSGDGTYLEKNLKVE
ncbi:MAG: hypothetical protein ACK5P7_06260 [Bdellovibrio sp.]